MTTTLTTKSTDLQPGSTICYGKGTARISDVWTWETESGSRYVGVKLHGFIGYVTVTPHDTFEVVK